MSYIVSKFVLDPIFLHVKSDWVNSHLAKVYEKQIFARVAFLAIAPLSFVTNATDTMIGVVSGVGSIITCGAHKATNVFASQHLHYSKRLLVTPYVCLLRAINPTVSHEEEKEGPAASFVIKLLKNIAKDCRESDYLLERHVASRLTYALLAISAVVARAADGVIGVIAAFFSFFTVGYFEWLNNSAIEGLTATGIINDLFCCAIKFINPWEEGVKFGKTI